ncbi:MAG: trigger factor [Pseudomonadota bacterium]|nr:trigger factor [Pseudomonadota bacterium]
MQVNETLNEGLKRELSITVPAEDLERRITAKLDGIGKRVKIPGFRPGKVPMSILEKRYGESVLGEVLDETVRETADKAMKDNNLRPAMEPKTTLDSFERGKDLTYKMVMEIIPVIEPVDFAGLEFERLMPEVDEAKVMEMLDRLADHNNDSVPYDDADHAAVMGDELLIDFKGEVDGVTLEGMKAEDYLLTLGAGSLVPGFEDSLAGAKAGEERKIEANFPEDYHSKELAGRSIPFVINIKKVNKPVKPEINDSFAEKLGMSNLEELKKAIRSHVEADYAKIARLRLKRALLDKLAEVHDFPVPESLVDHEFETIWKQLEHEKEHGSLDEEDAKKSDDDLKADYLKIAERRVRLGLLLTEVGSRHDIQVTMEEMKKAIYEEASRHPGHEKMVVDFYVKNHNALESLRAPVFEEKVVDYILEMAKIDERQVSIDELISSVDEKAA